MKIGRMLLAAGLVALFTAQAAQAGQKIMASAPAERDYPNFGMPQNLRCNILNLNTSPKPVTIDTMDYFGSVTSTSGPLVLAPSTAATHLATGDSGLSAYCRFTVDGSTKKYRAVATYDDGTNYTTIHAAP